MELLKRIYIYIYIYFMCPYIIDRCKLVICIVHGLDWIDLINYF